MKFDASKMSRNLSFYYMYNVVNVRSLSVSFFIEKEPHSSQEWNEREKEEGGERDTQVVRVNEATVA